MKPFSITLPELRGGSLDEEIGDAIRRVTSAVRRIGDKGKVKLTLTIKPATKGDTDRIMIIDDLVVEEPQADIPATFLFADENDNLSRKDPQQRLFGDIKDAPAPAPVKGI